MSDCDTNGRPWAKIADVKAGDRVEADSGFDCLIGDRIAVVEADKDGHLFIKCAKGKHYLAGQIQGDHYLGLYKLEITQ
jgi:hypothetical protein